MVERTTVRAMVKTTFRVAEDFIHIELEVTDHVRDQDGNTANAIDRVYGLVQSKVAEKAKVYIGEV